MNGYQDLFNTKTKISTPTGTVYIFQLEKLAKHGFSGLDKLPYSIRILLEASLRNCNNIEVMSDDVLRLAAWDAAKEMNIEVPFKPARVILQDFTGVPAMVDLAAMRSAMQRLGGDPRRIEPLIPCDLVIDHSVQTDSYGSPQSLAINMQMEFQRNRERYEFLKWGQNAFKKFGVIPPGVGIIHQVNLEYLARGIFTEIVNGEQVIYPDSLVGTDSHTTMINGLGIVGWGVGGIEAEAVMLGQPLYMLAPRVVGFELSGECPEGVTATDITLIIVQMLRQKGVVGKFVEFYGSGVAGMSLPDRATIANMAPEYGATMGFFPMDQESLNFMLRTGRSPELVALVERYMKTQGLFRSADSPECYYTDTLHLDLATVQASVAGPKRPQDRIPLGQVKTEFHAALTAPVDKRGYNLPVESLHKQATVNFNGAHRLAHGSVVIASITSCTNTSNPSVILGAGLLAQKAVNAGLTVPGYVKTSLAPGSRVVTEYLQATGLAQYLDQLGFQTIGYGCASCIGNSGPLPDAVAEAIDKENLVVTAVLSGNRNFEGRVNPHTRANYLASPPLVVAYALAGRIDIDFSAEPLGTGKDGKAVFLKDIWPSNREIAAMVEKSAAPEIFTKMYADMNSFNPAWNNIPITESEMFNWRADSTYIQEPPFFMDMQKQAAPAGSINNARVLALLGDSVTTDHISPAGSIAKNSPAAHYLLSLGVQPQDFNSYGARRGNDRVMVRGTFANIRLKNLLVPGTEGGVTLHFPDGKQEWIYDAAMRYKEEKVKLLVIAGKEYGTGSSRDWAAKGTMLLGVKAVLAESFERIHRSNLIGMGILALQFKPGDSAASLGLTGRELYTINIPGNLVPQQNLEITVTGENGGSRRITVIARLDTPVEITYYQNGGILQTVLRDMLKNS
ncbi:MAG TPA: aconitate hydratase AcnA [bacterium]|nr:aconitate hydratase AcnA [bacterium]HPN41872.1 aconitate hydratase AcnA [bacterium]